MLCDDWFPRNSAVEAMMAQQRRIEQMAQEALGYSRTLDHLLAQQRRFEELTARSTMADPTAAVMTQRLAEDACRTCSSEEDVRALLAAAQRKLTTSVAPTLKIIRGGGQGDGTRDRDHLRLVLRERAAPETDKP
jgi:hypothetical protein